MACVGEGRSDFIFLFDYYVEIPRESLWSAV